MTDYRKAEDSEQAEVASPQADEKKDSRASMPKFLRELLEAREARIKKIRDLLGEEDKPGEKPRPFRPIEFVFNKNEKTSEVLSVEVVSREPNGRLSSGRFSTAGEPSHPWRITHFDKYGPSGHNVYRTLDEVANNLPRHRDPEVVNGKVAEWALGPSWEVGIRANRERLAEQRERAGREATAKAQGETTDLVDDPASSRGARYAESPDAVYRVAVEPTECEPNVVQAKKKRKARTR